VLNRIRRALFFTRVPVSSRGRHRRPLTPSWPPASPPAATASVGASSLVLGRAPAGAVAHRPVLTGEDVALVRPYVLAWERRVRTRVVVVAPHLSPDASSALARVR
jgi:hypothetical protein